MRKVSPAIYDRIDNAVYGVQSDQWWHPESPWYQMIVTFDPARVLKPGGVFYYNTLNRTWASLLGAIKVGQVWKRWAFFPPNIHVWRMFIKPREMKSLLRQNGLEWKAHMGMMPDVPIPRLLGYLRKRASGEWTYAELAGKVRVVESRVTAIAYMGYALKIDPSGVDAGLMGQGGSDG